MRLRDLVAGPSGAGTTFAGLVVLYSPDFEAIAPAFPFRKATLTLGRDEDNDWVLPGTATSGKHAVVEWEGGQWRIRDAGSRNGVLVDGERIEGEVELPHGAELRIGDTMLKLEGAGAEGFMRHRLDGAVSGESQEEAAARAARRIVGGARIDALIRRTTRMAASPLSVMVTGESGTGKELFARHIHAASGRRGPFVAVNCGAVPEGLFEAELFGAVRGAFTGADRDREGMFRAAHTGTLFLDEIAELPLSAQAKLLRAVQEKVVTPLGGTRPVPADVRIVCATHEDLRALEQQRRFRSDLRARLDEHKLRLPPLRDRKEDLYLLCRHLLREIGRPDLALSTPFMAGLLAYDFPMNLRSLSAIVQPAACLCDGDTLLEAHLPEELQSSLGAEDPVALPRVVGPPGWRAMEPAAREDEAETTRDPARPAVPPIEELVAALAERRGNVSAVGRHYQRTGATVRRWLAHYGLFAEDFREA